ncbi:hypothetical protein, partial [Polymorphobacter multimanifer]|uniref:hypothetical protein n=1 Tax=Polymorphobacter multimanifer TaxID=1070431 RepID=UPI00166B0F25
MSEKQDLRLDISANSQIARAELEKLATDLERMDRRVDRTQGNFDKQFSAIDKSVGLPKANIAGFVAALSIDAIISFGRGILEAADNIATAADQAGLGAERYQTLTEALRVLELSSEQTATVFSKLQDAIGSVQEGTAAPALVATLDRLGILSGILSGEITTTEQAFDALAEGVKRYNSQAAFAADVTDVVGRKAGPALAAALKGGSDAVKEQEDRFRETGAVIQKEYLDRLADANEKIDAFFAAGQNKAIIWAAETIDAFSRAGAAAEDYLSKALRAVDAALGVETRIAPAGAGAGREAQRARDEQTLAGLNQGTVIYEQRLEAFRQKYGEDPTITVSAARRGEAGADPRLKPTKTSATKARAAAVPKDVYGGRTAAQIRAGDVFGASPDDFSQGSLLPDIDRARSAAESLAAAQERARSASAEYEANLAKLKPEVDFLGQAMDDIFRNTSFFVDDISGGIAGWVVGANSLGDALEDSFKRAGASFLQSGISTLFRAGLNA